MVTWLYDKRDDFDFRIANFPFISSNIPESSAYGDNISQLISYAWACSSYADFIDRGRILTKNLLNKIEDSFMIDAMLYYNIPILPFRSFVCVCDLVLFWCVLRIPVLTSPDMTGYALDSTQVQFALLGHLFTHLGFPECPCCLDLNICSRFCHVYGLMLLD